MHRLELRDRQRTRRAGHTRRLIRGTPERPRLSIHRSGKYITVQVIDDEAGKTVASASTMQKVVREGLASTSNMAAAERLGKVLAERALAAGVTKVAFDRGHYRFHGRVKAVADAARAGGLQF